jgi:hypothetical protein
MGLIAAIRQARRGRRALLKDKPTWASALHFSSALVARSRLSNTLNSLSRSRQQAVVSTPATGCQRA